MGNTVFTVLANMFNSFPFINTISLEMNVTVNICAWHHSSFAKMSEMI